jgi:hypothetical protein
VFAFQLRDFTELFSLLHRMYMKTTNQDTFCIFPDAAKPHQCLDILCIVSQNGHLVLICDNTGKTGKNSAPFVVWYLVLLLIDFAIYLISPQGSLSNI